MQKVTVLCVGKLKEKFYMDAAAEYAKRLSRFCKLELVELPEERLPEDPSPAQIEAALLKESAAIRAKLPSGAALIALCVEGELRSSEALARQMAAWASGQGYCAPGSGSYLTIVEGAAAAYGLEVQDGEIPTAQELCQSLASGHIYVALMTRGHFTNSGHFILLRGVTLEGKVLVADPNSRERSLAAWDPQMILDELSPSRSGGAPLWRISTLETLS